MTPNERRKLCADVSDDMASFLLEQQRKRDGDGMKAICAGFTGACLAYIFHTFGPEETFTALDGMKAHFSSMLKGESN